MTIMEVESWETKMTNSKIISYIVIYSTKKFITHKTTRKVCD